MGTRKNPETSIKAFKSLDPNQLNEMYKQILKGLATLNEATVEELAANIKVEKSRVYRRMIDLERSELIYRPGNERPLKSGRAGATWMLCNPKKVEKREANVYNKDEKIVNRYAGKTLEQTQLFKD